MQVAVGILARTLFWVLFLWIVGQAAVDAWTSGNPGLAVAAVVFAPLTYVVYPWIGGMVAVWVASLVAYVFSTVVGGQPPID